MKRCLLYVLFIAVCSIANAQIQYSIELGASSAMIYYRDANGQSSSNLQSKPAVYTSLNFGSKVKEQIANFDLWAIGAIAYDNRGYIYEVEKYLSHNTSGEALYNLNYISIPAYIQPRFFFKNNNYISLNIGAHISHLVNANRKFSGEVKNLAISKGNEVRKPLSIGSSIEDDYKEFDSGIILGLGTGWEKFSMNINLKLSFLNTTTNNRYILMNEAFTWSICNQLAYI